MRFPSLFSVTAVAAAVTLLASCSNSSAPTSASSATDPSFEVGPRTFTLTPANPVWSKLPADPIPTDTRTVLVGGLLAVATYPSFGTPVYAGSSPAANWLDMNLSPSFSLNPLGWKVTFKLKQSAQALPVGTYTATIPVSIPAALNNPQNIIVTFTNCGNCVFLNETKFTGINSSLPTFNWFALNYFGSGSYYFYEYRLILEPGETAYPIVYSSAFGNGATIGDPTIAIYNADFTAVGYDDDSCLGLTAVYYPGVTNSGPTRKEFLLRVSTYSSFVTGFENLYISPTNPCGGGGGGDLRTPLPDSIQAIINAKGAIGH
jgi:hypothetical protein